MLVYQRVPLSAFRIVFLCFCLTGLAIFLGSFAVLEEGGPSFSFVCGVMDMFRCLRTLYGNYVFIFTPTW